MMDTRENTRKRRPGPSKHPAKAPVKRPASAGKQKPKEKQRSASSDVVYLPPKPFQRSRLLLQLLTLAAVVTALVLGVSVFFKVDREKILVSGTDKYTAWDIIQASGIEDGENLLTFSRSSASGKIILSLPYVEQARFGIKLPDTLMIEIQEIQVTYAVQDRVGAWWLISSGGKVVAKAQAGEESGCTKILGVAIQDPQVGSSAVAWEDTQAETDPEGNTVPVVVTKAQHLDVCLDILNYLEQSGVIGQAASVDVSDLGDLELMYGDQYRVRLGNTTQLSYKIACMKAAIDKMDSYQKGVLDVTFTVLPDQVGFQPQQAEE